MSDPTDETSAPDDAHQELANPTLTVEPAAPSAVAKTSTRDWPAVLGKVVSFAVALFLFILAIQLMKEGAKAIAPSLEDSPLFSNGISTLGAGWLGAYIVLSGSPIAAVALSLYVGGALTELQTFTMLSGSRLGASFVVLLVVFLYAMRNKGRNRSESIGMGVLVLSLLDYIWGPALDLLTKLPGWTLLPLGLGLILISFRFLDRVLPQLDGERHGGKRLEWLKRPWPMFALGCVVATLTLSVSVALTVLVPLASRGYIKREESIPYIMGANITTLADTLVAAMVLGNAVAVHIVLAEAIGVSLVSLVFLAFLFGPMKRRIMALDEWVVSTNRRLWLFVAVLFILPAIFLTSGIWIGPIAR